MIVSLRGVCHTRHRSFGKQAACTLQAVTEPVSGAAQAAVTHLEALQIELCASERVDLNWVTGKYRAGSSVTAQDNRRVARPVLTMKPVRLCEHSTLPPGSRRLYLVRYHITRPAVISSLT